MFVSTWKALTSISPSALIFLGKSLSCPSVCLSVRLSLPPGSHYVGLTSLKFTDPSLPLTAGTKAAHPHAWPMPVALSGVAF